MLKRNSKVLAIVMAFMFCMTFLAPAFVTPDVASAGYSSSSTPVVIKNLALNQSLGSVIIDFPVLSPGYHKAVVKLPDSFIINAANVTDLTEYPTAGFVAFGPTAGTPAADAVGAVVAAQFTATVTGAAAVNDTVTISTGSANEVYTAVAAAPAANQFVGAVSPAADATALAAAITANAASKYTATANAAGLITLTQKVPGATVPTIAKTGTITFTNAAGVITVTNIRAYASALSLGNYGSYRLAPMGALTNKYQLEIYAEKLLQKVKFAVNLTNVNVPSSADAEINVTVMKLDGDFADGLVPVAKTSGGAIDVIRSDPGTLQAGASVHPIHLREDVMGAMVQGGNSVKIKLPKGVTWTGATAALFPGAGPGSAMPATEALGCTFADPSVLIIQRTTTGGVPAAKYTFTINTAINIDPDEAAFGDVVATVSGITTSNNSSVKLGSYNDFGYKVTALKPETEIVAGRTLELISDVNIKENVGGSFQNGRTIAMKLSDGVQWPGAVVGGAQPTYTATTKGGGMRITFTRSASDYTKASGQIAGLTPGATAKGEVTLEKFEVNSAVDFAGPIEIQFSGSAGINDKVVVAKAAAPVTAAADSKDVMIGVQGQAAGKITVTETKAEAIKSRVTVGGAPTVLVLEAPFGVTWDKLPTVKVVEGDLSIGTVTRGYVGTSGHQLQIPIKTVSSKASKIEITDIYYSVDRTVPEGDLKIDVSGTAVDQAAITNRTSAATVVVAKVVTPADKSGTPGSVAGQFKIDSNIYEVNGVAKVMDAAPYVKAGRTYVPVKFLGLALGVAEKDIVWDAATQKATLTLGDKKVELTIGSTSYSVNGEAKTMDVAPEISNGRTMLPAKYVAEGLGFIVGWDPATKTVLVSK